ncbi:MAG: hypothetical protein K5660_05200 [Paludibacteraceae bacterium]|nr:hypothetical protein [Paludibacteraceae bacterium]
MKTYNSPETGVQTIGMVKMLCASDSLMAPEVLNYTSDAPDLNLFGD